MGYIYKITNKINNTIYIGQTRNSIHRRWLDHCKSAFNQKDKDYNQPLHSALRKYGKDNFIIEQIEECPNETLNNKEIYWISYYNSYYNGYNASLGGDGHTKYNYDDIVNYYLQNNYSLLKTCQYFSIYDQVVYTALRSKGIDYKALTETIKNKNRIKYNNYILLVEKNLVFKTMKDIDIYFQKTAHPNIRRCLNGITKKAYNYHWKEISKEEITEDMKIYE